jgi:hypothetical protein
MGIDSTSSYSPYCSLEICNGVEIIILIFKRSIDEEVVTYHFGIVLGSLNIQQFHGFDELCNDEGMILDRTAKSVTIFFRIIF